jgi:hypothetical protein
MASVTLHCWFCEEQTKGKSIEIAKAPMISMIKAGKCCHLTCNDPAVENVVYLRIHPENETHDIKPFRMHCRTCNNQVGVVIRACGRLRPSFQQHSVIFKNENGNLISVHDWKNTFARTHLVVPNENLGSSTCRAVDDARFYVLDHKVWEKNRVASLRVQKDMTPEEPIVFGFRLSDNGQDYTVSAPVDVLLPGTTSSKSRMENDHDADDELTREVNKMNIVSTVNKKWKDVKTVPKKYAKPVSIQSFSRSTVVNNPFALLEE